MYAQVEKAKQNKGSAIVNSIAQDKCNVNQCFELVDNRPEAIAQRKLQEISSNCPQDTQPRAYQNIANNSSQAKQAAQLQTMANKNSAQQQQMKGHVWPTAQAPIQLRMYKESELRSLVREAVKTSEPNSTAILLAIYNEMRFEIDPTPGQFNSVVLARAAMIKADRIDVEDADALALEAARMQQAGGDPAEALRLRIVTAIAARRDGIEGKFGHHVFQGDYNSDKIPTGFHSKADGSATHEAYGASTDVGNVGAYQQSIRRRDNQKRKPVQSTFFPDTASHANVIDAITVVYGYGLSTVAHVDASVNGMRLQKKGATVFPAGGSDTRFAE